MHDTHTHPWYIRNANADTACVDAKLGVEIT